METKKKYVANETITEGSWTIHFEW